MITKKYTTGELEYWLMNGISSLRQSGYQYCDALEQVVEKLKLLEALEQAGVDNWEGISVAYDILEGKEDE